MSFDIGDGVGVNAGGGLRHRNYFGLCVYTRRRIADLVASVIVDGESFNHGENGITICDRILETLQQHDGNAMAKHRSTSVGVKGPTGAVGRGEALFLVQVIALLRKSDGNPASQRHVTLIGQKARARLADGYQRSGTCTLNGHARAAEVELVRDPRRHEILVIAEHRRVAAHLIVRTEIGRKRPVCTKIVKQVRVHGEAGINTDESGVAIRSMSGALQGLPCTFQEEAVLRIDELCLLGVHSEKVGIE